MGLEVYYSQDIRNALLAAEQASVTALRAAGDEDNEFAKGYKEGYQAALVTMALAFGLVEAYGRTEKHELKAHSDSQDTCTERAVHESFTNTRIATSHSCIRAAIRGWLRSI